jgi:hypothetical protein
MDGAGCEEGVRNFFCLKADLKGGDQTQIIHFIVSTFIGYLRHGPGASQVALETRPVARFFTIGLKIGIVPRSLLNERFSSGQGSPKNSRGPFWPPLQFWLPFIQTYRTLCFAPTPEMKAVFIDVRHLSTAG